MNMSIKIMEPEERKYSYTQSRQIIGQTGCIGHLRADLGGGKEFFSSWDDHYAELKTPEFKRELDQIINTLRFGPIYVDRQNCIIQDHDILMYDDGSSDEVVTLEDGTKGHLATDFDYLKRHPDAEKKYVPLLSNPVGGVRKLQRAAIIGLDDPTRRLNTAFCGAILESRDALRKFCYGAPEASYGNDREWGIRVDTQEHSYLMRLNPNKGEYNLYCYCYKRVWLEQHMEQARRGIRFISPHYEEKFRIPDGDQVRINRYDGEKLDRTVRYIDDYHIEISEGFGSNIYHIAEFAEKMERSGNTVIPLRSSLPQKCFVYVESTDEIGIVERGEEGYRSADTTPDKGVTKQKGVEYLNEAMGVSKAQAAAMSAGSLFGWDTKAADPANYNEEGVLQKKSRDRGDAR